MANVLPLLVDLLIVVGTLVGFVNRRHVRQFTRHYTNGPISHCLLLPYVNAFIFYGPVALDLNHFVPRGCGPDCCTTTSCDYRSVGNLFPRVGPNRLFICLNVTDNLAALGLPLNPLTIDCLLINLIAGFFHN